MATPKSTDPQLSKKDPPSGSPTPTPTPQVQEERNLDAEIESLQSDRSLNPKERNRRIEQLELALILRDLSRDPSFPDMYRFFRRVDILSRSWHRPFDLGFTEIAKTAGLDIRPNVRVGRTIDLDMGTEH